MDQNKQQVVDRLKQATNILVTVSANPSIDQLASCIGVTLFLNKLGKHATAVFSGEAPSTIEFLQPEETLEKDTNSLRDFIISLDKSKADKLRYKVEQDVVKIFITPYRTSLSDADLNFSQGDFNVEAVLALGVTEREDLDRAIVAHGRILHDATVMSVSAGPSGELGSINWSDPNSSSLCEMVTSFLDNLKKDQIDNQIATALLTGIVAQTDRFSNERTSPQTMSEAAKLMSAGANQQLIATKLQEPTTTPVIDDELPPSDASPGGTQPSKDSDVDVDKDGTLSINHYEDDKNPEESEPDKPLDYSIHDTPPEEGVSDLPEIHIDDSGNLKLPEDIQNENQLPQRDTGEENPPDNEDTPSERSMILEPPTTGGTLTSSADEGVDGEQSADPLSSPAQLESILQHGANNTMMRYEPTPSESTVNPSTHPSNDLPDLSSILPSSSDGDKPEVSSTDISPPNSSESSIQSELPSLSKNTIAEIEKTAVDSSQTNPPPITPQTPEPLLQTLEESKTPDQHQSDTVEQYSAVPPQNLDDARNAVLNAIDSSGNLEPVQGMGTSPLSKGSLHPQEDSPQDEPTPIGDILAQADQQQSGEPVGEVIDPTVAPEVPPPLLPPLPPIQPDNVAPPTNPLFNNPGQ